VVAKPLPAGVVIVLGTEKEQIPLTHSLKHVMAVHDIGQCGGKLRADPFGDAGRQEEVEHGRVNPVEDVVGEYLADAVVVGRQVADEFDGIVATPQTQ
jgi:hypothetical protein